MTSFSRRDLRRAAAIPVLVAVITALHYGTDPTYLHLHVLYRELYFVPILLAALRFGKWGGLGTALATTALYAPHIAISIRTPESTVGNVLEIVFFCVFGGIVGSYVDIRRGYEKAMTRPEPGPTDRIGRRVLVCLDGSAASQSAASCAGDLFGADPETSVTLLWLPPDVAAGPFTDGRTLGEATSSASRAADDAIKRATSALQEHGVGEGRVGAAIPAGGGERPSDVVLRAQREGHHDVIVVPGHRLTRAQEFLFGNVAVRLVREAPCPVLVVEEPTVGRGGGPTGADPGEHANALSSSTSG